MKQIYPLIYISILLVLLLSACVEETDWEYQTGENGKLVVESILTNEVKTQIVQLSTSFDEINGLPSPVSNAIVTLNNGQNDFTFLESTSESGKYLSSQAIAAQMGINYTLQIQLDEQIYSAQNEMTRVLPSPRFTFETVGATNLRRLSNIPSLYSTVEQAMFIIDIDWSHLTDSLPNKAKQIFYTFKTIDASEVFSPDQKEVVFPRGSIVIATKYGLNDEFASYLRALALETEWQGGFLDENSASLPTNISNDGLGFFGVCAVLSDTLIAL